MRKIIKSVTGLFLLVSMLLCVVIGFYYVHLPDKYYLCDDDSFNINAFFNISAVADRSNTEKTTPVYAKLGQAEHSRTKKEMELKLLGVIPIKTVTAERIERPELIPGGTPFGIKMLTEGAVVTELGGVDGVGGYTSPARNSGNKPGDVILKVNGMEITKNDDVAQAVQLDTAKTHIVFTRDGYDGKQAMTTTPVKSSRNGMYKIGMWVRDSSAGIGTMTFYNPANSTFGGLGHAVCDVDTGQILPLASGEAVQVYISGVVKGMSGAPGELSGTFISSTPMGILKENTEAGVFGIMQEPPEQLDLDAAIPMAYKQEVTVGPAKVISTLCGDSPQEYDIIIEKIDYNDRNRVKNMVIKITDRRLLNKSGGIVQGMSGSPIVQNGKLVGAVTHVFVSDPTRGYAIFAENMYRESLQLDGQVTTHNVQLSVGGHHEYYYEYEYLQAA